MSLICNETLACEQCIDCQKVLNHQYADIIEIDGEEESIKKKHICGKEQYNRPLRRPGRYSATSPAAHFPSRPTAETRTQQEMP